MKSVCVAALIVSFTVSPFQHVLSQKKPIDQKVDSVLKLMRLEEKVGQMNQYHGPWATTGPLTNDDNLLSQIKEGKVGSMLNVTGVARTKEMQKLALQLAEDEDPFIIRAGCDTWL